MRKRGPLRRTIALIFAMMVTLLCLPARASDSTDMGDSLEILFEDGETPVPGAQFDLYLAADLYGELKDKFAGSGVELDPNPGGSKLVEEAEALREWTENLALSPDLSATTDEAVVARNTVLKDGVSYTGLTPGKEYRLEGTLMDPDTGSPVKARDREVSASMSFIPESEEGSVIQSFDLDASSLSGKSVVVYEKLYRDDYLMASHEDPEDENQTVSFGGDFPVGGLSVLKKVTGDGDVNREWHFTVTLDQKINGKYGDMEFIDGVSRFVLKSGDSALAEGLPIGSKYTVTEEEANRDGYTTSSADETGTIGQIILSEAVFINDLVLYSPPDNPPANTPTSAPPMISPPPNPPATPGEPGGPQPPQTGDNFKPVLWISLAAAGICCMLFLLIVFIRKRRNRNKEK